MEVIKEIISVFEEYGILEVIGTLVGILYLWYEWKADIKLWIVGIIMPTIYLFVYYNAGLYADSGIQIYYIIAAIYGWAMWKFGYYLTKKKQKVERKIVYTPWKMVLPLVIAFYMAYFLIKFILINYTNSNVPTIDSFTTALSIIGLWMLAKKYAEQWWVWAVVDVVSSGLYVYKGLYFTAALYAVYAVVAVFGYFKWIKLMNNEEG